MSLGIPVAADVAALLAEAGAEPDAVAKLPLDRALRRAVEALEADTGFIPFLVDVNAPQKVCSYAPPRSATLELRTGFVSISSVICRDALLVEGDDFELRRFNGRLDEDLPFTEIKFFRALPSRGLVLVNGVRGFCTSLSQTVFDAICARAALFVAPSLIDASSATSGSDGGAIKAKTVGDMRIEYTSGNEAQTARLKASPAAWQGDYDDVVEKHTLTVWGF